MTAPDLLSQLLQKSAVPDAEQIGTSVILSLQNSVNDPDRDCKDETTQVLHLAITRPDVFVSIAKHIPTAWIDFLSGSHDLWSKIIDQMIEEVLAQGADKPSPLFSLVRRWSHPQSTYSFLSAQCSVQQIYWETMKTIALHPKGQQFVTRVRSTKGPVRHWLENFHIDINNSTQIDGVAIFEKLILDLPPTPVSDSLWLWRMEKSRAWYRDFPSDKIHRSSLSPHALAYTIAKSTSGSVSPSIRNNIFSWKEPLKVIQEMKSQLAGGVTIPFVNSLIEENLVIPMSEKVWKTLQQNPLEFFVALDVHRHTSNLMKEFASPQPLVSLQDKHSHHLLQFAVDLWTRMGKLPPTPDNIWEDLTVALHDGGLLPHVMLNSLDCFIASEDIRWGEIKHRCPTAVKWADLRPSQENSAVITPKTQEDEKRMIMMKMIKNNFHHYNQLIKGSPDLIPKELTPKQSHQIAQALCDNIKWDAFPLQEIAGMSEFFKEIKILNQTDVRSLLLWSFLRHYKKTADALSHLLTEDSNEGDLLKKVLHASTSEAFPYASTYERPFEQVIQKFLLMEAANYSEASSITKRKI